MKIKHSSGIPIGLSRDSRTILNNNEDSGGCFTYKKMDMFGVSSKESLEKNMFGNIEIISAVEAEGELARKRITFNPGSKRKSASTGASPAKMESCMFNFPIPTPRMWTIMVEPITKQAAGQPKLQHWRPNFTIEREMDRELENTNSNVAIPDSFYTGESCSTKTESSVESSPKCRKRHRIYLNGTCIDSGAIPRRRGQKVKAEESPSTKVFTFIADKRMAPATNLLKNESLITKVSEPSSGDPTNFVDSPVSQKSDQQKTYRRGRKLGKKPLTFHQLEFNNKTLKPFDRSVFIVANGSKAEVKTNQAESRPPNRLLVEAAEILLELQSDTDTSLPSSSRSSIESPTIGVTSIQAPSVAVGN